MYVNDCFKYIYFKKSYQCFLQKKESAGKNPADRSTSEEDEVENRGLHFDLTTGQCFSFWKPSDFQSDPVTCAVDEDAPLVSKNTSQQSRQKCKSRKVTEAAFTIVQLIILSSHVTLNNH